ncbi:MAG: Membrane-bound lytic murein transglycosylase B [Candidatus Celerinatantimonas neptuna]|nr:MAG: Membrane-bound lytic murein transglycosylase B [Candidatus Celerinatantimonas neptuna]
MRNLTWIIISCLAAVSITTQASPIDKKTKIQLKQLSQQTKTSYRTLRQAVEEAKFQPEVIKAITKPWEAKPWYQYRALFLKPKRVREGVEFWKKHAKTLAKAQRIYHVPPELIVAIIGVETFYGRFTGNYSVLNALYTLGFHYPPRGKFFRKEFASFVKLSQQQKWSLGQIKGSYAGAMGYGQFIPSSYLHYAVDFNNDGRINMLKDPVDGIGSVANYFHRHHWHEHTPVAEKLARAPSATLKQKANRELSPQYKWQQLTQWGATVKQSPESNTPVNLLRLKVGKKQSGYWVTYHNFYVITRYNRSPLYAMAVYQLSQQIKDAYYHP